MISIGFIWEPLFRAASLLGLALSSSAFGTGEVRQQETVQTDLAGVTSAEEERTGDASLPDAPRVDSLSLREISYANLLLDVSERFVAAGMVKPLDYDDSIRANLFGATVTGVGHTTGQMDAELVDSSSRAVVHLLASGRTDAEMVGQRRRVTIKGDGVTTFVATKEVFLDSSGMTRGTSHSNARSNNRPRRVSAPPVVRALAWRYVQQRLCEANRLAARHAEPLINDKVDEEANEIIQSANKAYAAEFRDPLLRCGAFPKRMAFSSTNDILLIEILQMADGQTTAPEPAPVFQLRHDVGFRLHETAFNNLAESLLAGQTLTDEQVRTKLTRLLTMASLDEYVPNAEDEHWSVTFAQERPINVLFDGDVYKLVVSGTEWTSGRRKFRSAMDVTVAYSIQPKNGKVQLIRDDDILIAPPGFVRGKDRLSPRTISLRRVLQRHFEDIFPAKVDPEGIIVPGPWEKAGTLDVASIAAENGWLQISWKMRSHSASDSFQDGAVAGAGDSILIDKR